MQSNDNDSVLGYNIYVDEEFQAQSDSNAYEVSALNENATYSFSVTAFDPIGNESANSNSIEVTTLDPTVSIGENAIDDGGLVKVYPNPANNSLTIETEHPDRYSIEITSLNGQLIFSTIMVGNTHQLDLSSFQKGAYLITIRSKDFVKTEKIIKLK